MFWGVVVGLGLWCFWWVSGRLVVALGISYWYEVCGCCWGALRVAVYGWFVGLNVLEWLQCDVEVGLCGVFFCGGLGVDLWDACVLFGGVLFGFLLGC